MNQLELAARLRVAITDANDIESIKKAITVIADELDEVGDEERWEQAISDARMMLEEYKKIPTGVFGAMGIAATIARYDRGERTKDLLEELEGIQ